MFIRRTVSGSLVCCLLLAVIVGGCSGNNAKEGIEIDDAVVDYLRGIENAMERLEADVADVSKQPDIQNIFNELRTRVTDDDIQTLMLEWRTLNQAWEGGPRYKMSSRMRAVLDKVSDLDYFDALKGPANAGSLRSSRNLERITQGILLGKIEPNCTSPCLAQLVPAVVMELGFTGILESLPFCLGSLVTLYLSSNEAGLLLVTCLPPREPACSWQNLALAFSNMAANMGIASVDLLTGGNVVIWFKVLALMRTVTVIVAESAEFLDRCDDHQANDCSLRPCTRDCVGFECGVEPVCGESCGTCGPDQTCEGHLCVGGDCETDCPMASDRRCDTPTSYQVCGEVEPGCTRWGASLACPAGESCSSGTCSGTCVDECPTAGQAQCYLEGVRTCGNQDGDSCLEWSGVTACPAGETCSNGVCSDTCSDECQQVGDRSCPASTEYRLCGDHDTDDCLDWGPSSSCDADQRCNDVTASPNHCLCDDQCAEPFAIRCLTQTSYQICADSNNNGCLDWGADPGGPGATLECPVGQECVGPAVGNACAAICTPDCTGRECGPDGCGGSCAPGCGLEESCNQVSGLCECLYQTCVGSCCASAEACLDDLCCQLRSEFVDNLWSGSYCPSSLSMDTNSAGRPHVLYRHSQAGLKYAFHDGAAWQIESLGFSGTYAALGLDGSDRPHIAWQNGCDIVYAVKNGSWIQEIVASNACGIAAEPAIAVDAAGNPHICYAAGAVRLYHASRSGTWQSAIVDATGQNGLACSIVLGASNRPMIVYNHLGNADVKFARFNGVAWDLEVLDADGPAANYTAIRLDGAGNPHVTYEGTGGALRYARWVPLTSSWDIRVVSTQGGGYHYSSLDLDAFGNPHLSFYVADTRELKYAIWNGAAWNLRTADTQLGSNGNGEQHRTMIRLDGTGAPWFVFSKYLGSFEWTVDAARSPICH